MKPLKMLGLTALTAFIAMAFVGASPAMAESTALCKADEEPCAKANLVTHVHETTLAGSPATLLNNLGNVTCDVLFLSSTVGAEAAPQVIKGSFTYTNCLRSGSESCTVTELNGPSEIKVLKEGHETANVTGAGEVKVKCGSSINCVFNGEGLYATAKGPLLSLETNGSVSLNNQLTKKVSGSPCPTTAELDITTTPLSATYLGGSPEETGLCATDESPCAKGNVVTHVHEATLAGSPATLLNSVGNVTCDALFLSSTVRSTGTPQIIKGGFTYSNCLENGSESCTVTELNGPSEIKVIREGHETASVTGAGEVKVKCGSFINCTYDGEGLKATVKGPLLSTETTGSVSLSGQTTHKVSGFLCPATAELDITTTPLSATYLGGTPETGLCATDESPCAKGNVVTHVHEATLAGSPATLLNSVGNVTCDALFLSSSVGIAGTLQVIKGNFTYSNCLKSGSESCTVTELNGPSEIKVIREGHETANLTGTGEVKVKCGSFISCTYNGEGLEAVVKGPLLSTETNGSVSLSGQTTHKVSGFLCPATAELDITTTPLSATYLGETKETMVCIFVGTNNGFYLGASGTTCTSKDGTRVGAYELAIASTNTTKTHICAFVGATSGFYLSTSNGVGCEKQDGTRLGEYELGITQ